MRVTLQRVKSSVVRVDGEIVGSIDRGYTLLIGIAATDTTTELEWMARKVLNLRLFPDPEQSQGSSFQRSIQDISGGILAISQFTLYGDCRKGRRPSFDRSAPPAIAEPLYDQFVALLSQSDLHVSTGRFGADMEVSLVNDGPVTLLLERESVAE